MGQYGKIRTMADMPAEAAITNSLTAAKERIDATGTALKIGSKPKVTKAEIPMPDDFASALAKLQGARDKFDALAPSHRREYLEWIAEGKKRNWKYENC
jgi:uncharacterized protein YdeI (YjbR/CyaY-like superfamily)